jgi:hypothetical protein
MRKIKRLVRALTQITLVYTGLALFLSFNLLTQSSGQEAFDARTKEVFLAAIRSVDSHWDSQVGLIGSNQSHTVRGSAWYGLGLMTRNEPGDFDRGLKTLRAVAATQYAMLGMPWDGTFRRTKEEKLPPLHAKKFIDYDPNWREFVGTVFALALIQYGDRISKADTLILEDAIKYAIQGELKEQRLLPSYTNISLMYAFLWTFAGERFHNAQWLADGQAWTEKVYKAYLLNGSFDEFNSPTYYGVDLYGLALLRRYGVTPRIKEIGSDMEAGLWRMIARFYNPSLRNLAGPYDRAYGMDMTHYASLVGVWLSFSMDNTKMPLPKIGSSMDHGGDFLCAMTYAPLGTRIPPDVLDDFTLLRGERLVVQKISDGSRIATAWISKNIMIGAEETGLKRGILAITSQYHPATIHWKLSSDAIGWVRIIRAPLLDAKAEKNLLTINSVQGDIVFRIHAPKSDLSLINKGKWALPNLAIDVNSDAVAFSVLRIGDDIQITYNNVSHIIMHTNYLSKN